MKTITPIGEKIVLKRVKQDDVTKGGIIIPEVAKGRHTLSWIGEVVAVGPGKALDNGQRRSPEVHVGDKVVVPIHIESEIQVDGEEFAMVLESQLLGVLEDE